MMRCFLGLLLCVCVGLQLTEGLMCFSCKSKHDGVDCYNNGISSKTYSDGFEKCGEGVGYTKQKASGGEWERSDISRGASLSRPNGCVKHDFKEYWRCDCHRFCDGDNCNDWPTPDSPNSSEWGSNNNC